MADGSIIIDTQIDNKGAESGLKSLGGKLGGLAKGALVGITAATGAVAALTTASIKQYSQYEQLTGGVETLFKASSDKVMEYANNAYKTAGMSANEYMTTITGFSASLLQGLGGDTEKAAEIGNKAVTDMSDNANKMGTSMESIQNAYQGFAKQNYTMLDNLKLGYGGTKTEMERLLADAEKISGMHYDISNFSDVIEAIHVIQDEMGITGTTAKEAMSTIEGSLNMTKSAWSNMLTGMADDNADFDTLVNNLVESAGALGENLLPRIQIALNGIGELISKLLPTIAAKVPELIMSILPGMVTAGINIVTALITGIQTSLPNLASGAAQIVGSLFTAIATMLPQLLTIGLQAIGYLAQGIGQQLPTLIPVAVQCVTELVQSLVDNMPLIVDGALQLIQGLAEGIINAIPVLVAALPQIIESIVTFITTSLPEILTKGQDILLNLINGIVATIPQLINMLPQIITTIINFIVNNLPQIITTGIQVLVALINGIIQALPQLIAMLPQIINTTTTTLLAHLPEIITAGVQILVALIKGLIQTIPQLVAALPQIISSITKAFTSVNWLDIGVNIIKGIGKGILNTGGWLWEQAKSVCSGLKDKVTGFFGIHSPSRVMRDLVGVNLVKGIGVGLDKESSNLYANAEELCNNLKATVGLETARTTATYSALANKEAGVYSNNETKTITNDNGININIEKFNGNDKQDVEQLAQEIAFLTKRKPV